MSNEIIFYKDKRPVNLKYLISVHAYGSMKFYIDFSITGTHKDISWEFEDREERNLVLQEIKQKHFKEIKIPVKNYKDFKDEQKKDIQQEQKIPIL